MDHCCNPTGAWDGACVNLGVYYANTVNAKGAVLGDICGRDAWSQSSIRSSSGKYQNYPRDFNVFTFTGDVTHMYEVQGPIATPGSFVASSFRLNWSSAAMPIALVADSLSLAQGTIYGDVYYDHGSQPGQTVTMQNGGEFYQGTTLPVDFVTAATRLTSMSNALSRYSQNTAVTIDPSSQTITLDGVRKDLSVVNLTSSELNAARHISITVPVGAAMLINVHGGTSGSSSDPYPAFSNVSIQMLNGTLINDVLWNFPDAVQVSMSSVHFAGSLLAPQAALYEIGGGEILGTLVVKSVASATYMEVYFYPFSNNWFVK
jgi:choice-of-anchor A domain-containing protein